MRVLGLGFRVEEHSDAAKFKDVLDLKSHDGRARDGTSESHPMGINIGDYEVVSVLDSRAVFEGHFRVHVFAVDGVDGEPDSNTWRPAR